MKECRQCKVEKDDALFHSSPVNKDGLQSYCIACQCVNKRAAYQRNKESRQAEAMSRYIAKRDAGLISEAEKARKKQYDIDYRAKHNERLQIVKKSWVSKNKELMACVKKSYKSRRRAIEKDGDSTKTIYEWTVAQEKTCKWCGIDCEGTYHIDHIMPLALGGKHEISNLCISCATCNIRKNAMHPDEWLARIGR